MSTVVLTPTHIACDHTIIHKAYPHYSYVDPHYPKIFTPPSNLFLIGTVGNFIPEQINSQETYEAVATLLSELIAQQFDSGLSGELAVFPSSSKDALAHYANVFDWDGRTFLVTRHYRFLVARTKKSGQWYGMRCGDYTGIGSGGMLAAGMLMGKTPLDKIWGPLHDLDPHSSREYTSIPLNSLKKFTMVLSDPSQKVVV